MNRKQITPEVIALARKLHELGYRQEIREGDWYVWRTEISLWTSRFDMGDKLHLEDAIPIPDLSTCLRWLEEHGDPNEMDLAPYGNIWRIHYGGFTFTNAEADTPEEACMQAMIKILEDTDE